MPLQLWVQAAHAGLRIKEVGVPRLYLDPTRAFGGVLNDAEERLAYYRRIIAAAEAECPRCRNCRAFSPAAARRRYRRGPARERPPAAMRRRAQDGAVVAVPAAGTGRGTASRQHPQAEPGEDSLLGRPLPEMRDLARASCIAAARRYSAAHAARLSREARGARSPLLLAGHQPELFHPGVWVKNFALAGLARRHRRHGRQPRRR